MVLEKSCYLSKMLPLFISLLRHLLLAKLPSSFIIHRLQRTYRWWWALSGRAHKPSKMGCHYIAIEGSRSRFSFSTKLQLNGQWISSHLSVHWLLCHGSFADNKIDNKMQLRRPSKVMQGLHILQSLSALRESRLMLSLLLKVLHREWVIAAVKAPFVVNLLFNSSFNVHPIPHDLWATGLVCRILWELQWGLRTRVFRLASTVMFKKTFLWLYKSNITEQRWAGGQIDEGFTQPRINCFTITDKFRLDPVIHPCFQGR